MIYMNDMQFLFIEDVWTNKRNESYAKKNIFLKSNIITFFCQ